MTLDALFSELAELDWLVNNMYQLDDGTWRVSLRSPGAGGDWFTGFAERPTLEEALAAAIDSINTKEWTATPEITGVVVDTNDSPLAIALAALIPPKRPISRRNI